jgi:uncharacterized membrane protein YhaH (DUF805 family)
MNFGTAIKTCLRKYAVFGGRAGRPEYWYFFLFCLLVNFAMTVVQAVVRSATSIPLPVDAVVSLALLLPQLSAQVRRVHDADRSGWPVGVFYIVAIPALAAAPFLISKMRMGAVSPIAFLVPMMIIAGYGIFLFVLTLLPGTHGGNRYGPDPKAPHSDVF